MAVADPAPSPGDIFDSLEEDSSSVSAAGGTPVIGIAVGAVGGVLVLVVGTLACVCRLRRRQRKGEIEREAA